MTEPPFPPCADCSHATIHMHTLGCLADGCTCPQYVPPVPAVVSSPTLERARAERDAAMVQVEAAASPEWVARAESAVVVLSGIRRPFSTDDVWDQLAAWQVESPREPRALGPVVKRALRDGVIEPDGFTQSRRRHAALIRTYTGAR